MKRQKYSREREDYINDSERLLRSKAKALQNKTLQAVIAHLISNLVIEDGKVLDRVSNYNVIAALDRILKKELGKNADNILFWMVRRINTLASINKKYFDQFGATKEIVDSSKKRILGSLGASLQDDTIIVSKNGFLSDLTNTTRSTGIIKSLTRTAVGSSVITFPTLRKTLTDRILGRGSLGLIEANFYDKSKDTFTMIDRSIGKSVSKKVGIRAAVFQGGLITTTRDFCEQRNNKVFTFDEIRAWANLNWQGKPDSYDPFTDVGGINCRHVLDYISDRLAIRLRPELKTLWNL